jgi:NDP-sugar pyrophosphorylase family protein
MRHPRLITISAAGKGERMRQDIKELGFPEDTPKPLLPTGTGETLIGRIARQAMEIAHVEVYANYDTIRPIGESPDLPGDVSLLVNRNIYGPLGPLYLDIFRTQEQSLMAAGDFWANFKWGEFLDFHNKQETPVSILVAPSVPTTGGARFKVDDDGVVGAWERVDRTTSEDLINIGAYIVDPEKLVMKKIRELTTHKEDPFNDIMIAGGLMSAYVLDEPAYNVNNAEIYRAMIEHTRDGQGIPA